MSKNLNFYFLSCVSYYMCFSILYQGTGTTSLNFYDDKIISLLTLMTALIVFVITKKIRESNRNKRYLITLFVIVIIFFFSFKTCNLIIFYTFFEISVIPLIFLVTYWGYSLERIKAIFYIFLYTFFFSFPFLTLIIYISKTNSLNIFTTCINIAQTNILLTLCILTIIVVKIPIWGLHMWLMKAHVEASTEGSMVLASVVLKLAGIAIIKISFFLPMYNYFLISSFFCRVSITGAVLLSIIIIRQRDLKLIVAVSSIVHISFLLILYFINSYFSLNTLLLVIVAHGLVSPLIFLFLGTVYDHIATRTVLIVKGALKGVFFISIIWFVICIFNIAVPLSINFLSEVYFFLCSISYRFFITLIASLLIFLNGVFNIYIFISMTSGESKNTFSHVWDNGITFFNYTIISVVTIYPIVLI